VSEPVPIRDGTADAKARKKARRKAKVDKEFTEWVHTQPCVATGEADVEQHHFPYRSSPHWHDRRSIPLTAVAHRGKFGFHTLGKEGFEKHWKVDTLAEIKRLQAAYLAEFPERVTQWV